MENKGIDLNQVVNLTKKQAQSRYNMCDVNLRKIAESIGAVIYCGRKVLYSRKKLDRYFEDHAE